MLQQIGSRCRLALGKRPYGKTAGSSGTGSTTNSTPILALKMTLCFPRPDFVRWGLRREVSSHEETIGNREWRILWPTLFVPGGVSDLLIALMVAGTYGFLFQFGPVHHIIMYGFALLSMTGSEATFMTTLICFRWSWSVEAPAVSQNFLCALVYFLGPSVQAAPSLRRAWWILID